MGGYELQQLLEMFESVDSDGDGAISLEAALDPAFP